MTRKGPLFTLLGGGAFAAALLVASINAASGDDQAGNLVAGQAQPTQAPEPTEAPVETPPPSEPAEEIEPVTYVGYVDGGDASVAIIVTGDEAIAYVCDGNTVEAWLEGPARNGELVLDSEDGELIGSFDETSATGQTTVDEIVWTFTVEKVDAPEGLYRFADTVDGGAEVEGATIVLADGSQIGVTSFNGVPEPAPQMNPETGEIVLRDTVVIADRVG